MIHLSRAIDANEAAMKTYMHNSQQGDVVLINESVNKILANVMKNKNNQNLPKKVIYYLL